VPGKESKNEGSLGKRLLVLESAVNEVFSILQEVAYWMNIPEIHADFVDAVETAREVEKK